MTKAIRSPALVVRAFNVEVARVQDQTSDPQTAAFRLQFWQDTLQSIFVKDQILQNVPANPIAQELFKVKLTTDASLLKYIVLTTVSSLYFSVSC